MSPYEFSLTAAESKGFEAQVQLEKKNLAAATDLAYQSMIHSGEAVLRTRDREYTGGADQTGADFKKYFFDTGEFCEACEQHPVRGLPFQGPRQPPDEPQ